MSHAHAHSHDHAHDHGHGHDKSGHHGFSHPMPVWKLIAVFLALIVLTVITVAQASMELGNVELIASLFIATIKASLVIMFFMHMLHDKPLNAIIFLGAFIFVALFLGFTLMDAGAYRDSIELKIIPPDIAANPMK